jgi:UDP-3-O-[3-hydroxymyristoyl] glucosamine N-acyltransferase
MNNVASGAEVVGSPALPAREFWRMTALLRRMARRRGGERNDEKDTDRAP